MNSALGTGKQMLGKSHKPPSPWSLLSTGKGRGQIGNHKEDNLWRTPVCCGHWVQGCMPWPMNHGKLPKGRMNGIKTLQRQGEDYIMSYSKIASLRNGVWEEEQRFNIASMTFGQTYSIEFGTRMWKNLYQHMVNFWQYCQWQEKGFCPF